MPLSGHWLMVLRGLRSRQCYRVGCNIQRRCLILPQLSITRRCSTVADRIGTQALHREVSRSLGQVLDNALKKRSCPVGDWVIIRDMLESVPSVALAPVDITSMFQLLDRSINGVLAGQVVRAAVRLYLQQKGSPLSQTEISQCFFQLRSIHRHTNRSVVRDLLCFLTDQLRQSDCSALLWRSRDAANLMFGLNKISSCEYETELDSLIPLLVRVIRNSHPFTAREIGNAVYGLRNLALSPNQSLSKLSELLDALTDKLLSTDGLDARAVSSLIYGVNRMSSDVESVRRFLSAVTAQLPTMSGKMDAQGVGNIMYGLRSLNIAHDEVTTLLRALIGPLSQCTGGLSSQELSNTLYGLQKLDSSNDASLAVVAVVIRLVKNSNCILTAQGVGNALYGMQGMDSCFPEVKELLCHVCVLLGKGRESLTSQEISTACYGLQKMDSDSPEVLALLKSLATRIGISELSADDIVSAQSFGNSLYGCQNLKSNRVEVRELLQALHGKLRKCSAHLKPEDVSNFLYGFKMMEETTPEVQEMLQLLGNKIARTEINYDVPFTPQQIVMSLHGIQKMESKSDLLRTIIKFLTRAIRCTESRFSAFEIGYCFYSLKSFDDSEPVVQELILRLNEILVATMLREKLLPTHISGALSGMRSMTAGSAELLAVIRNIGVCMQRCEHDFTGQDIHNCLYGINNLNCNSNEVKLLLRLIHERLVKKNGHCFMQPQEISGALYGLRSARSCNASVRGVIAALTDQIIRNREENGPSFPVWAMSNMIYSLDKKLIEWAEMRRLVGVLAEELQLTLQQPNTLFTTKELGMVFYGVNSFYSSDTVEFNSLIDLMCRVPAAHVGLIDGQCMGNMLYGLHSMSSRHNGVRNVLSAIAKKLEESASEVLMLRGQAIGNALYGLQGMKSSEVEVRRLVTVMNGLIHREMAAGEVYLTGQEIGNALYGLQNMDNREFEVSSLISTMFQYLSGVDIGSKSDPQISGANINEMNGTEIGMSLFGLQNMTVWDHSIAGLTDLLLDRSEKLCTFPGKKKRDKLHLLVLLQNICLLVYAKSEIPWVQHNLTRLKRLKDDNIRLSLENFGNNWPLPFEIMSSATERKVFQDCSYAFNGADGVISVTKNEYLEIFEADIVIRLKTNGSEVRIINIEVDGPWHNKPTSFGALRDSYLSTQKGVTVLRISSDSYYRAVSSVTAVPGSTNVAAHAILKLLRQACPVLLLGSESDTHNASVRNDALCQLIKILEKDSVNRH